MLVHVDDGQGWTAEQSYELAWINAAPGSLSGTVFDDADADGVQDAGEPPLVGWTVYLDENQNGKLESGERTAVTNASGQYSFTGVPIGDYTVGISQQLDLAPFAPVNRVHAGGQTITGLDFSLLDADGNPASLDYDIDSLTVTSTSSSGTTEVSVDAFGNPVRSVDEQG
ncbi:MAG: SdrD B-like domain-containing protein, partial [Novipirellula sp. JB048]